MAIYLSRRLSGETLVRIGKEFQLDIYGSVSSVVTMGSDHVDHGVRLDLWVFSRASSLTLSKVRAGGAFVSIRFRGGLSARLRLYRSRSYRMPRPVSARDSELVHLL